MKIVLSVTIIFLLSIFLGAVGGYAATIVFEDVPQVLKSHSTGEVKEIRYPNGFVIKGEKAILPEKYELIWVR